LDIIKNFFQSAIVFFYEQTNSWGWSIIILTVLIKIVLFPSSVKQYRSMHKMKQLQPKLKEIQEKYKDKPEELNRRTMELYQKENVSIFSGCLPMIFQMVILIIFYRVLQDKNFIEMIGDATFLGLVLKKNQYWQIALISGLTTFLQQKLTMPATGSDQQSQSFLYFMPLLFGYITFTLSATIGIYWVASNIIGIIQQYIINEYFIVKEHIKERQENNN